MDRSSTIVACATPPGRGSVAIIRLSGPRAFEYADRLFRPAAPPALFSDHPVRTVVYGTLELTDNYDLKAVDNPLAIRFRAPHSFTGEDVIEIHLHGNPFLVELVIDAFIRLGADPASPGEFSRRAFLNGKMDLTQVEALAALISSESQQALVASQGRLSGDLHLRIQSCRNDLLRFLSLLELELDFVEEGYALVSLHEIESTLRSFHAQIQQILSDASRARPTTRGPRILIAGKPNAGKSSLFNALLGHSRAIVSETPGTTRDFIEASLFYKGTLYHLYDTAGIRLTTDPIEEKGIEAVHSLIHDIDYLLFLVDSSQEPTLLSDSLEEAHAFALSLPSPLTIPFLIFSKSDRTEHPSIAIDSHLPADNPFVITCTASINRPETILTLLHQIHENTATQLSSFATITTDRQRALLTELDSLFHDILESQSLSFMSPDTEILSFEIRQILTLLDELRGSSISEELLDVIFSQFCIGK